MYNVLCRSLFRLLFLRLQLERWSPELLAASRSSFSSASRFKFLLRVVPSLSFWKDSKLTRRWKTTCPRRKGITPYRPTWSGTEHLQLLRVFILVQLSLLNLDEQQLLRDGNRSTDDSLDRTYGALIDIHRCWFILQ